MRLIRILGHTNIKTKKGSSWGVCVVHVTVCVCLGGFGKIFCLTCLFSLVVDIQMGATRQWLIVQ